MINKKRFDSGQSHEISSPARTLGSWVPIPFKAWMSVRISSVFVLSCVGSGVATGLIPRPRSPTNCLYKIHSYILILMENTTEGLIRKKKKKKKFWVRIRQHPQHIQDGISREKLIFKYRMTEQRPPETAPPARMNASHC
jgi:hypothetical protein